MKKIIVLICIFFSLKVNLSASPVTFPVSALSTSFSASANFPSLSFASYDREEDEEKANDLFATLIALMVIGLGIAYYWLNTVRFFDYPYCENSSPADGNYITRGSLEGLTFTNPGFNRTRFAFDSSLVFLNRFGLGNETRFEGLLFPYIGPYFENLALYNFQSGDFDYTQKGLRDNLRTGGQLSLLQTNILSVNFLVQYATWFGKDFDDFKNGVAVGILLRSYPINPLVLEWKACVQDFGDFSFFDWDLHLGIMREAYEYFVALKFWGVSDSQDDFENDASIGMSLGFRRYFSLF